MKSVSDDIFYRFNKEFFSVDYVHVAGMDRYTFAELLGFNHEIRFGIMMNCRIHVQVDIKTS
jgi:hypothetical protein